MSYTIPNKLALLHRYYKFNKLLKQSKRFKNLRLRMLCGVFLQVIAHVANIFHYSHSHLIVVVRQCIVRHN